MRKSLVSLLLAVVPALALSACNGQTGGSTGVAALPNTTQQAHARVHPDDYSATDLHAGGATFPAFAYNLGSQPVGCALTGCSATGPGTGAPSPQAPPGSGSLFASAGLKGTIYYCLTSSGDGRKAFYGGTADAAYPPFGPCAPLGATATGFGGRVDPLDFAGSDVALASTEYTIYHEYREPATGTNYGEPFEFPAIGGPIAYAYRPQDFKKFNGTIKFSTWTYCAITNGTITNWDDPAITADNGASVTAGKSEPITFYFRSDGSGTSYNLIYHLNTVCNGSWKAPYNAAPYQSSGRSAAWTFGPPPTSDAWNGPGSSTDPNTNFIGESGSPGLLAAIQDTPYSIGYLEGGWAKSANPAVSQALLQSTLNKKPVFVDPTDATDVAKAYVRVTASAIQYGGGSDGITLQSVGDTRPECILYIPNSTFTKPPTGTYPIVAVSYLLFYGNSQGVHSQEKKNLIKFLVSKKANALVEPLEYTPLNAGVQTAVLDALEGGSKNGGKAPCTK